MGLFSNSTKQPGSEIDPDEILLDSSSRAIYNDESVGRHLELPLPTQSIWILSIIFSLLSLILLTQIGHIQIVQGDYYAQKSENNRMNRTPIFAERGVIYDVQDRLLAWNDYRDQDDDFFQRRYSDQAGLAHMLGYIRTPLKDRFGIYYQNQYEGLQGVEKSYQELLSGINGLAYLERDALGNIRSQNITERPTPGQSLRLSIDKDLQQALYDIIADTAERVDFDGGAGLVMDVETGEILTLVSYPEYDPEMISRRNDPEAIERSFQDERNPFLNRALSGVYTPGSVMKLFVAIGALEEELIDPGHEIVGGRTITVPNPYNPTQPSIFSDWRVHGSVDMRQALAVSSNIYFYHIGGGFADIDGLGITKINDYMERFGFGQTTGINLPGEKKGLIPNPDWKAETFEDSLWRLGDTYNTAIGQFGFQITPVQLTRAVAAIANGGRLIQPTVEAGQTGTNKTIEVSESSLQIVREGMRQAVTDSSGTARGLQYSDLAIAAKTGTAELGIEKDHVNSWITGYFPYEDPKYAFTVMMESGPADNLTGGVFVMRQFLDWMRQNTPEHLEFDSGEN